MPYKDKDKQREYQREYMQRRRRGSQTPPGRVDLPPSFRLQTARDLVGLLEGQIDAVQRDPKVRTLERARCIGSLINVGLRALEQTDVATRIEALEAVLGRRGRPEMRAA
jgi:hypothetical protein